MNDGAGDAVQAVRAGLRQRGQQLGQGHLAFADHHHVGAVGEVLLGVVGALRAATHHLPAVPLGRRHDFDNVAARHQVGVDAQHAAGPASRRSASRACLLPKVVSKISTAEARAA